MLVKKEDVLAILQSALDQVGALADATSVDPLQAKIDAAKIDAQKVLDDLA
jgi:hypothetical protein